MVLLLSLILSSSFTNTYASVPDEWNNHYQLTFNYYNVSSCSSVPYNTTYYVEQCESNSNNLPDCCLSMLKTAGYIGNSSILMRCNTLTNESSYYAMCQQYYTDTQVEYGMMFGYIVLAIICVLVFGLFIWVLKKYCCGQGNGYDHL